MPSARDHARAIRELDAESSTVNRHEPDHRTQVDEVPTVHPQERSGVQPAFEVAEGDPHQEAPSAGMNSDVDVVGVDPNHLGSRYCHDNSAIRLSKVVRTPKVVFVGEA